MSLVPHLVQYQGSKRSLAPTIAQYFPGQFHRLIEPFSGTGAMSIYSAFNGLCEEFVLNDINKQITSLLEACIDSPDNLAENYQVIWNKQFAAGENSVDYYYKMRDLFNQKKEVPDPALTLFILARVAKGAIRYNQNGEMNQICDRRRQGTKPETIKKNADAISALLKGHTQVFNLDYNEILSMATTEDVVYMDPPYQGVARGLSSRYVKGVEFSDFVDALRRLNERNIRYIVSYDGQNDDGKFGQDLPEFLNLKHILINAGRSAQGNLNGKAITTYESLYISSNIEV